ncbi:MAG: hypothetical protein IPI29_14420 [Ignavibacteria bacterium]|nr:hypothetical protein [Ignavibacteria bacterium]
MKSLVLLSVTIAALLLTGCPSAKEIAPPPKKTIETLQRIDAVRIKPEAASKYIKLTSDGVNRDGRTLRGMVEDVRIVRNASGLAVDTVWSFRDVSGTRDAAGRVAIPLRDIVLLPVLYPEMQTDSNRGINLVESFHVTKEIPEIRMVPVLDLECAPTPLPSEAVKPPCDCEPFEIGLHLNLACANREYSSWAIAALVRGSAYTDGKDPVSEGTLGAGVDALVGYRFGPSNRWLAGVTFSTGLITVNNGDINPSMTSLDGLETFWRPLILATGRYYFVGFDKAPPPRKTTVPTKPDTRLRYADNRPVPCPELTARDSTRLIRKSNAQDTSGTKPHTLPEQAAGNPLTVLDVRAITSPCYEDLVRAREEYELLIDSIRAAEPIPFDEPIRELFGGCIKPYVYGELGVAIDAMTQASASMALNADCNECVAALREANADGSLGVDWSMPLTFGFGVGLDIPISRRFDFEIDLGYRSVAVGDAYQIMGFSNVPDTRRLGSFQLRLGVIF